MASSSEQDPYAHEVRGEELAEQKAMYRPMRTWYVDARSSSLQKEHGTFPAFWQDLAKWPAWRPVRKAFLRFQDTGEWPLGREKPEEDEKENEKPEENVSAAQKEEVSESEIVRELYEPMRRWYESQESVSYGPFPPTLESLRFWSGFKAVTSAFLDADTSKKRCRFGDATGEKRRRRKRVTPPYRPHAKLVLQAHALGTDAALAALQSQALVLQQQQPPHAQAPSLTREQRQEVLLLQMKLKANQERTMNFAGEFDKWLKDPQRPASPPPIYGPDGKRANTAEVRFKQELARERADFLRRLATLQPQAAQALGEQPAKPTRRLYIPVKEYPNVCFMGLILGPRGNHHKRMEKETGCRIRIRGRGSLREGSRGKDAQRDFDDDKDDLHVYVEGPTEEAVQAAADMVEPLLNPESAAVEKLKDQHQTELAEINGTLRSDSEYCHICGEKGHRQWECPAKQRSYAMANVRCALCGDTSHPTRDCSLNAQTTKRNGADASSSSAVDGGASTLDAGRKQVDSQFLDFMTEIGADPGLGFDKGTSSATTPAPTLQAVHPAPTATAPRPVQFAPQQQPRTWFSPTPNDAWYKYQQQQQQQAAYQQYYLQQQQQQQAWAAYYAQQQQFQVQPGIPGAPVVAPAQNPAAFAAVPPPPPQPSA